MSLAGTDAQIRGWIARNSNWNQGRKARYEELLLLRKLARMVRAGVRYEPVSPEIFSLLDGWDGAEQ